MNVTVQSVEARACLYGTVFYTSSPLQLAGYICYFILMLIIGPVGILFNTLAFIVLGRERPYTSTSIYLRALAVADGMLLFWVMLNRTIMLFHKYHGVLIILREIWNVLYPYSRCMRWFSKISSIYITVSIQCISETMPNDVIARKLGIVGNGICRLLEQN